jgi:hypothetical protein
VKFLYSVVFHKSSVQPGSDILRNRCRVLSGKASEGTGRAPLAAGGEQANGPVIPGRNRQCPAPSA